MKKFLIIDDNSLKAKVLQEALTEIHPGCLITWVTTAEECTQQLLMEDYDLLCLDWEFPKHAGEQAQPNGPYILEYINDIDLEIKVIIFSAANIRTDGPLFDKVQEFVYCSSMNPKQQMNQIASAIQKI